MIMSNVKMNEELMKHHRCITLGMRCCIALACTLICMSGAAGLGCYIAIGVALSDREKMADHAVKQIVS